MFHYLSDGIDKVLCLYIAMICYICLNFMVHLNGPPSIFICTKNSLPTVPIYRWKEGWCTSCNAIFLCVSDLTTYYHLPMDRIRDQTLVNPSGLDAKVTGYPEIFPGVVDRALKIDGRTQKITVSGPGHRDECFGNLKLCKRGKLQSFICLFLYYGTCTCMCICTCSPPEKGTCIKLRYM